LPEPRRQRSDRFRRSEDELPLHEEAVDVVADNTEGVLAHPVGELDFGLVFVPVVVGADLGR
jgi:hypothetical protein